MGKAGQLRKRLKEQVAQRFSAEALQSDAVRLQRMCGIAAAGRGNEEPSAASSVSEGSSDGDSDERAPQPKRQQRGLPPAFDIVAFFDRLSTR